MSNQIAIGFVALVALVGLASIVGSNPTGAALRVIDLREYQSLGERMCPDPDYPVPVFALRSDLPGTTGKQVFKGCVKEGTKIPAHGRMFRPEFNRKSERFSYGHQQLNQL